MFASCVSSLLTAKKQRLVFLSMQSCKCLSSGFIGLRRYLIPLQCLLVIMPPHAFLAKHTKAVLSKRVVVVRRMFEKSICF